MQNDSAADLQLLAIFDQHPTRSDRYRAALKEFRVKLGSLQATVFRLWFDEKHAQYERRPAAK